MYPTRSASLQDKGDFLFTWELPLILRPNVNQVLPRSKGECTSSSLGAGPMPQEPWHRNARTRALSCVRSTVASSDARHWEPPTPAQLLLSAPAQNRLQPQRQAAPPQQHKHSCSRNPLSVDSSTRDGGWGGEAGNTNFASTAQAPIWQLPADAACAPAELPTGSCPLSQLSNF